MVSTVAKEDDGIGADDDADSVVTDEDGNDFHCEVRIENGDHFRVSSHQSGLSDVELEKSDTEDDIKSKEKLSVLQLLKSHKAILVSLAVSDLVCFMCLALMAPFYPKEVKPLLY